MWPYSFIESCCHLQARQNNWKMSANQNCPHTKGNIPSTYSQQSTTSCCSSFATSMDGDNSSNDDASVVSWSHNHRPNRHHPTDAASAEQLRVQNALMRAEINTLRAVINDRHHHPAEGHRRLMPSRIVTMSELNENWTRRNVHNISSRHLAVAADAHSIDKDEAEDDSDSDGETISLKMDLFQPTIKCPPAAATSRGWQQRGGAGFTHSYGLPAHHGYIKCKISKNIIPWPDRLKDFCWFLLVLFSFLAMYTAQNGFIIAIVGWRAFFHFSMWKWFGLGFISNIALFQIAPFLHAVKTGHRFYRSNCTPSRIRGYWVIAVWFLFVPTLFFLAWHFFLGHPVLTPPDTKFPPTFERICDDGVGRKQICHHEPRQYEPIFLLVLPLSFLPVNAVDLYFLQFMYK